MRLPRLILTFTLCVCLAAGAALAGKAAKAQDFPTDPKWDLTEIFTTVDDWKAAKADVAGRIDEYAKLQGTLGDSPAALLKAFSTGSGLVKDFRRLAAYAGFNSDLDVGDTAAAALRQEIGLLAPKFGRATAWLDPELLALGRDKIESFFEKEKGLAPYGMYIDDLFRTQEHTLSESEERILAATGLIAGVAGDNYRTFTNDEMPFPEITLADGTTVLLNQAAYTKHRSTTNREDRQEIFRNFFGTYKDYEETLGNLLYGTVKRDVFYTQVRNYDSAVARAVDANNIPEEIYRTLVDQVNENLGTLHRFFKIQKRLLGVEELGYHDLYAPIVTDVGKTYPINESMAFVLEALEPLGGDYVGQVRKAFLSGWIDAHPKKGKRQGAYSSGSVYDLHPFVLLNHNDDYETTSTLAHEMGHAMHSYLSNKTQPYPTSGYSIFLAEIASTFNEVLLNKFAREKADSDEERLFLLGSFLDGMRQTLFRQTMFAEFELEIHERVERGEPLTGEILSEIYGGLLRKYHGHDQGIVNIDPLFHVEWSYIPHFYRNFYVYQYSTGIIASSALAKGVMEGGAPARDRYLEFLSAGSSDYPVNLLKKAGVDMTTPAPYQAAFSLMNEMMDEIEEILDKRS
jgi:oligoendopeptidase F